MSETTVSNTVRHVLDDVLQYDTTPENFQMLCHVVEETPSLLKMEEPAMACYLQEKLSLAECAQAIGIEATHMPQILFA